MSNTTRRLPPKIDNKNVPKEIKERYRHGLESKVIQVDIGHNEIEIHKNKAKKRVKKIRHKTARREGKREINEVIKTDN